MTGGPKECRRRAEPAPGTMRVTILGTGYVGLVTGLSLCALGHRVTCIDVDTARISMLQQGAIPFFEPGLDSALGDAMDVGLIRFDSDMSMLEDEEADIVFVCVGTPGTTGGATDLSQVADAVKTYANHVRSPSVLAVKSTVPVGTTRWIENYLTGRGLGDSVSAVSNPEFLREGMALLDAANPARIVIGASRPWALEVMERLYRNVDAPILCVSPEEAELIKYASNAFLALRLSYVNTLADFCEHWGADIRRVASGMGMDPRIGHAFLRAGLGFGGSCLPKDVRSLAEQYHRVGLGSGLLLETLQVNGARVERAMAKLRQSLGDLSGKRVALLGLAFKPGTDDIRESQSMRLLTALTSEGCRVRAYDPRAVSRARAHSPDATYTQSARDACTGCDAVVVATEWPEFRELPWDQIIRAMKGRAILDCRNFLNGKELTRWGAHYLGMGIALDGMDSS